MKYFFSLLLKRGDNPFHFFLKDRKPRSICILAFGSLIWSCNNSSSPFMITFNNLESKNHLKFERHKWNLRGLRLEIQTSCSTCWTWVSKFLQFTIQKIKCEHIVFHIILEITRHGAAAFISLFLSDVEVRTLSKTSWVCEFVWLEKNKEKTWSSFFMFARFRTRVLN